VATPEVRFSSQARPATSGVGWYPSSKARAAGFAASLVSPARSRHASRRRRKWSQGICSTRSHSIARSRERWLPGRAWLECEVEPTAEGAIIHQTAGFEPAGLSGVIYWYVLRQVHAVIFGGMLREIAPRAGAGEADTAAPFDRQR
jgi:hypothetical protein